MTSSKPEQPATAGDRRSRRRGRMAFAWHLIYGGLRTLGVKISSFYVTLGVFMVGGIAIAIVGAVGFSELAEHVLGQTPPVDIAILTWLHDRQSPLLTSFMLEMTYLGTGTVVVAIVGITALFLWHTEHKLSARLLLASTIGNIILNGALKLVYHRARPNIFQWQTEAVSSSFPSGHAMSATVVYGTVAYLLMRLQKHHWSRVLTLCGAVVVIALICTSRMYLGVHYPSDVIGGVIVGLAWASFCMATLEASIVVARRRQSAAVEHEAPAPSEKVEPVPEWNI